jgi:hypothetical protein
MHGHVRCTVSVHESVVAGHELGLRFSLRNLTRKPLEVADSFYALPFTMEASDGTAYDTRVPWQRSTVLPIALSIPPGATRTAQPNSVWVRWPGPLTIHPVCEQKRLGDLRTRVKVPGPVPDSSIALTDVVSAAAHLFDHCRPTRSGVVVAGDIDPPSGSAPPMHAACSITLDRDGPLLVAQALVVVPTSLQGVEVHQPYEEVRLPEHVGTAEAIAWEFVVTAEGALPVATNMAVSTKPADRMAPDWDWTGTRWEGPGGSHCGQTGGTGGVGIGASIEFVSVCPP